MDIFKDKELFIQTQTNLSIDNTRLISFLDSINNVSINSTKHKIDICSSYHLNKQNVNDFVKTLKILDKYNVMGLVFINTDYLNEEQFIEEFKILLKHFPNKIKLRFTEIQPDSPKRSLYPETKNLKSFEYFYFVEKYDFQQYFEEGFNFMVNDKLYNFSEISALDIHKHFRFMKCDCFVKNIVIDHNLKVYHCNDDFKNNINVHDISDVNSSFFKKSFCLNKACYDGLEFRKYR
jgi:hypothetical protein